MRLNDLDSQTRNYFRNEYKNECPGIVKLDFNGDGRQDYAVLLRNNKSKKTKFVILFCLSDSLFKKVYELDVTNFSNIIYLSLVKKGARVSQTESIETNAPPQTQLKYDGVRLTYFEKAEIVIFWNEKLKKIETIQTAD